MQLYPNKTLSEEQSACQPWSWRDDGKSSDASKSGGISMFLVVVLRKFHSAFLKIPLKGATLKFSPSFYPFLSKPHLELLVV